MEYIWQPFYTGRNIKDKDYKGAGLGLAIVRIILEAHDSQFGVRNTPEGVGFYFELPAIGEKP